jgi:hypothetical protein
MNQETPARVPGGFQKPPLRHPKAVKPIVVAREDTAAASGTPLLRTLVWTYFILLLVEGALRKWWLAQYSAPLLVIRDPVVLLIYMLAHQQRIVPRHALFGMFLFQAVAGVLLVVSQYMVLRLPPFVLFYGYRTLFLHFPLIFVLPYIFRKADVVRLGQFMVFASIPMAALMAYQFNSAPDAWINKTVGVGGTLQIASAMGKIRPPGTFSFISGPVSFFAIVTAFVGYGLISGRGQFPRWLLLSGVVSIGLASAVSGSRAAILSSAIVVAAAIVGALVERGGAGRFVHALPVVVIAVFMLGKMESFQEGTEVLSERIEISTKSESAHGGIIGRFLGDIIGPLKMIPDLPFFGAGLGVGTNVGSTVLTGRMQFLISEGEWGRILLEMGPLFGVLFIWFRVALTWDLGKRSLDAAKRGDLLPLLLFSACGVSLFSGQIAQPTILGFTVLGAALCACCLRDSAPEPKPVPATPRGGQFKKNAL